jgi:hypothetical protein
MSNGATNDLAEADEAPAKRTRGPGKVRRARRNYVEELRTANQRIETAVRLLKRCQVDDKMIEVAIATLEGQP